MNKWVSAGVRMRLLFRDIAKLHFLWSKNKHCHSTRSSGHVYSNVEEYFEGIFLFRFKFREVDR